MNKNSNKGMGKQNKRRKLISMLGIVVCILTFPIIAINFIIIGKSLMNPEQIAGFMGFKPLIVTSGSMSGEFEVGDLIIVKNVKTEDLEIGDIIAFRDNDSIVTHRIAGIKMEDETHMFITKGDSNNTEDSKTVEGGEVEGRYVQRFKQMGNFAMFLQKTEGILLVIVGPIILLAIYEIIQKKKNEKCGAAEIQRLQTELEQFKQGKGE